MAVLPAGSVTVSGNVEIQEYPSFTWIADRRAGRITSTGDGLEAVKQAVEIILNADRFQWQIYSPYFGMQWENLIGRDPGYVASELQRRMKDAFSTDGRISGIEDFTYSTDGDSLTASFTIRTIYGDIQQEVRIG